MSELLSAIDAALAVDVHTMAEPSLLVHTETLLNARDRLDAAIARSLQALDAREVTVSECGRQTKAWLVVDQHLAPKDAAARMWVARRLPAHPTIRDALASGELNHEHVRIVIGCLDRLAPSWREAAETELVEFGRDHDPRLLAALCRELQIRTGADEDAEAAAQRQFAARYLTLDITFEGMVSLNATLDPAGGAIVTAALNSLMSNHGAEDTRSTGQTRADALVELAERGLDTGALPDVCGDRPHVVITIGFEEILRGVPTTQLGTASIDGKPVAASTARMYACDAEIIPAVLGGGSEVLDLGRSQRHWTRAQRRAARLRDAGCTWPGCQTALDRCRLHHIAFWGHGGTTNLDNATHLCRFHHWLIHHSDWKLRRNRTSHRVEVSRTAWPASVPP